MNTLCGHEPESGGRQVCSHLASGLEQTWSTEQFGHFRHFTGKGLDYVLLCPLCSEHPGELSWVCGDCFVEVAHGARLGTRGSPEIRNRQTDLKLELVEKWRWPARLLAATACGNDWVGVNDRAEVMLVSPGRIRSFRLTAWGIPGDEEPELSCARDLLLISPTLGTTGVIANVESGEKVLEIGTFPGAFFERQGRCLLVHGEQLEISDPYTGERVGRLHPGNDPAGGLSVSRDGRWLAATGSPEQPLGSLRVFDLQHWDAAPRELCRRDGSWGSRPCWVGSNRLALSGLGEVDALMLPGIRLFDVESGQEIQGFVGPEGRLVFDEYLFCLQAGLTVWDVATGECLFQQAGTTPLAYHPQRRLFLSQEDN
ncbi:hypothetical protein JST97_33565, partial [bacterium]|nr:hypothetical protein [bacterium]